MTQRTMLLTAGMCVLSLAGCTGLEQGQRSYTLHTLKELRDVHVVKQAEDYSCGAASLATVMRYYYGDDVTEADILSALERGMSSEEKNRKNMQGFSLLDLKNVAEKRGYRAAGFRIKGSDFSTLSGPVIVLLQSYGYKHFAVYRGMTQGRVFLADPARGNLRMSLERFLDEWEGIIFVLSKAGEKQLSSYPLLPQAPDYFPTELFR